MQQLGTGVPAEDIQFRIEIAKADSSTVKTAETAAQQGGFRLAAPLMEFNVTAAYNDRTVAIESFSAYVERTIALPAGTDSYKITTGVVIEADGSTRHVPTKITLRNGIYYARINSLTNSAYTVVWHPLEFADVANHWSKTSVNDMGSRMVINGISDGFFAPDEDINRAEFAAVVVRALGLKPGVGTGSFIDVQDNDWYAPVVKTAAGYGLISGYEDRTFRPNAKITREEAMVLVSRAMKLTGLSAAGNPSVLAEYSDAAKIADWAKEAAAASISTGLVSGRNQAELAPQEMITRAETAVIIRRLLKASDLIS
ncbi:Endo-1,4-beta-xylanase A precursor [compost metagenome]